MLLMPRPKMLPQFLRSIAFAMLIMIVTGVVLAAPVNSPSADAGNLRVMTFNVRNSNAQDGENAWPKRIELLFETITGFNADLIGFQEVLAVQHDEIKKRLSDYSF